MPSRPGIRAFFLLALTGIGVPACATPPAPEAPAVRNERTLPPIEEGGASPGASAEAARLLGQAREALEAERYADAVTLASRVINGAPGAPGSSEAFWIVARGEAGREVWAGAAEAAARFRRLLPPDHSRAPAAIALEGRALSASGSPARAVELLLHLSSDAGEPPRAEALEVIRAAVTELPFRDLQRLVESDDQDGWPALRAPLHAEYALGLHARRLEEDAGTWARSALELTDAGPEAELARSILSGEVSVDRRSAVVLGALLPRSGSPSERQYAVLVAEGIAARLGEASAPGTLPAEARIRDDSGSVSLLPRLVEELTDEGVLGIVGPLGATTVEAAARARSAPVPLLSPSAEAVPPDLPAVYSLNDLDPGGAVALARYAASRGLGTAFVLHAATRQHILEADAFVAEYERLGGAVVGRRSYQPGATFFEAALDSVRQRLPGALVLPVPVPDIELLAPQLTYFGLDTLGVRVLGTEAWGEPVVIQSIEPRHLNGIVVATPRPPGEEMPGWARFVEAYETVHRQTLRSSVPALGWDAAGLLLEAVSRGARDPEEMREALESIRAFPGATGFLSIEAGAIRRRYHLMRPRDREIIPVDVEPPSEDATP